MERTLITNSTAYIGSGVKKDFCINKDLLKDTSLYSSLFPYSKTSSYPLFGFVLVGKGLSGKNCGNPAPEFTCQSCLKCHWVISQCNQKTCSICWINWLSKAVNSICTRIYSKKSRRWNKRKRLSHVVVSPDPSLVTAYKKDLISFEELKKNAKKYLSAKSSKEPSGTLIFHPFRPNERYYKERKEKRREKDENPEEDGKKWEWIREKADWYNYVKFSPHFHFVGYTGWLRKPEKGEKFIYKLIRNKEGNYQGIKSEKELRVIAFYLLSHAGARLPKQTHTYVWVGNLAYNMGKFKKKSEVEKKRKKARCKACGGPLGYFKETLKAFFKVWLNTKLTKDYEELKKLVLYADIPKNIKKNVLEDLDILQDGKPPPDWKEFLISS